jgi:excinuclease ABC subunit C
MSQENEILKKLSDSVARFPQCPGIYIMKDAAGRILYIGKAVNLRSRVRSYFLDTHDDRPQIPVMMKKLAHIEWIATEKESEALILEANLIRRHKPRYNVDLKDDKHYPYLKVTVNEPFPRLYVTRRVYKDGARYFGPYTDARAMRSVMSLAKNIFKIRDCKKQLPLARPVRPCLNYAIGRCSGACGGKISQEDYRRNIHVMIQFLAGRRNEIIGALQQRMDEASGNLAFEKAAALRDQIELVTQSSRLQQVDLRAPNSDTDIFGLHFGDRHACLCVLSFRNGLLLYRRHFLFRKQSWEIGQGDSEMVILQYYRDSVDDPPNELLLPANGNFDRLLLEEWFKDQYRKNVKVAIPRKGQKAQLLAMAEKNARLYCMQKAPPDAGQDCIDLQKTLQLPLTPQTIEAFDISNLGETFAVAGMVRFADGVPDKSQYRRYKIKSVEGQNDFAMMMEAVQRRLSRLTRESTPFPDLLLIDGGKGQLNAAIAVLRQFESPPMIISLAKKEEVIFSPYRPEPVHLPETHPARKLVQRIRDEVHRWAIQYHRTLRGAQFRRSSLEAISGIGPAKAAALLKRFGSLANCKTASIEEIASIPGFSPALAQQLKEALRQPSRK